jgi:transcriptional regulator with XRE-family HTH domain
VFCVKKVKKVYNVKQVLYIKVVANYSGGGTMYESIGKKITHLREGYGMSKAELGRRLGYHGTYIYYLETGQRRITVELLQQIANIFNVELKYFFDKGEEIELDDDKKAFVAYMEDLEKNEGISPEQIKEWVEIARRVSRK